MIIRNTGLCFCILLIGCLSRSAEAQYAPEDDNVESRPRPEFDPLGIRGDSFTLFPRLLSSIRYDDNVFADENGRQQDLIAEVAAEIDASRQWRDNELNLTASVNIGRYDDFSSEDFDDWRLAFETRLRPSGESRLLLGVDSGRFHLERSSISDADGLTPVEYSETNINAGYTRQLGRYQINLETLASRSDFDDVFADRTGGRIELNQDDRDRTRYVLGFRGAYSLLPVTSSDPQELFFRLKINRRDYDDLSDFSNLDRSSDGYETAVGLSLNIDHIFVGDIYIGYRNQDYEDPFPDISAPEIGATLDWHFSRVTTFNFGLARTIEDTVNTDFSGYTSTQLRLGLVYEPRRHLLTRATLLWADNDFDGVGSAERDDTLYVVALGLDYLFGQTMSLSAGYSFVDNDSDDNTVAADESLTFRKNILFVSLKLQI